MRRITWKRDGFRITAACCVAFLLILGIVLFAVPAAHPSTPAPVTIDSISWTVEMGNFSDGTPWFIEKYINQSGALYGFPFQVAAGHTFNDSLVLVNAGTMEVPLCSVSTSPPLYVVATNPVLPAPMEQGEDNLLVLTIYVTADSGATVSATGIVDALGCSIE
jgi:hypothetical protein